MAKKTSSSKRRNKPSKTARQTAASKRAAAGASSPSKKTKTKAPAVKKAKTTPTVQAEKAAASKAPKAPKKKRPTTRSSANAAAAALAAIANNHHRNGEESDEQQVAWTDAKLKRVKTGLTRKDLEHFRKLLFEKRGEILGDVDSLQNSNSGGAGNLSNMPLHMADVGSDNYEQEFTLGLVEWERKLLNEIDNAIERINKGTYGVCLQSGVPIPRERLEIKPWAKYSIEVVRERERRGQPT